MLYIVFSTISKVEGPEVIFLAYKIEESLPYDGKLLLHSPISTLRKGSKAVTEAVYKAVMHGPTAAITVCKTNANAWQCRSTRTPLKFVYDYGRTPLSVPSMDQFVSIKAI